jgi:hypothetical protein
MMSGRKHAHILSELYAHPIAHNIEWVELIPALASVGMVHAEKNGSYHFTRNGRTVVFEVSKGATLGEDEIMKLRHFLRSSAASANDNPDLTQDMVVAIDQHQAAIYSSPGEASESRAQEHADLTKARILHTRPTSPPYSNTGPVIDEDYYRSVIGDLANARRIAILSHGTGSSNAASQLMARIREYHPELAHRVVAIQRCDLEAMSEAQIIGLGKKLLGF